MLIPISASNGQDVDAALDRAEQEVAATVKPLLASASLPEFSRTSGAAPAKPSVFGVTWRKRIAHIDAGRGRVAMLSIEWRDNRPQQLEWTVRPVAPGSESMASSYLGCLLVLAGWGAFAYANLDDLLALHGRAVKITIIGGVCCMFVTGWIGFGLGWFVQTKLCRMFFGAQWRAAEEFSRDVVTPKMEQAFAGSPDAVRKPGAVTRASIPHHAHELNFPATFAVDGLRIVLTAPLAAVAHAQLDGSISLNTMATFEDVIRKLKAAGTRFYILDFERLNIESETGLGILLGLSEVAAAKRGKVVLVKVRRNMKDMFEILGLGASFTFVATGEEALELCR